MEFSIGKKSKSGSKIEYKYFFRTKDGKIKSPFVDRIMYYTESNRYLFEDKLVIDEMNSSSLYFYADKEGNILGVCYVSILDEYFPLNYETTYDLLNEYSVFKFTLATNIRKKLQEKKHKKLNDLKKLSLIKNKN